MDPRLPFEPGAWRTWHGTFRSRLPGPLGCLAMLVVCPLAMVAAVVGGIVFAIGAILGRQPPRFVAHTWAAPRTAGAAAGASPGPAEEALRRLVRALALDDTFSLDDARQAGTLAASGATVDDLLGEARRRDWIEDAGEGRLRVTERGRRDAQAHGPGHT